MSEDSETPIIDDSITAEDAGFNGDIGDQPFPEDVEAAEAVEVEEEVVEEGVQAETKEELKEEIEEAIEEGATEEDIKDMVREYTIKVNGVEKKIKIDLNNEADMVRRLQLAEVSHTSMQDRKEMQKSYEDDVREFMKDPKSGLKDLGLDPIQLGEEWLKAEVEERKKSPDLRAREKLEYELTEARSALKEQQEKTEQATRSQLEAQEAQKLESEIEAALDSHEYLPRSQKTVSRIADALLWAIEHAEELNIDPNTITVEDVIPSVQAEIREELQQFMQQLPEEMMEEYIGQKNLERLRKKRLSTMKTNNISNVKSTNRANVEAEKSEPKSKMRSRDYFNNLGRNSN